MSAIVLGVVIGFLVMQVGNLSTTLYLHRSLAHRGVTYAKPVQFGFRVVLWLTTGIKPREWVAVHRKHHAFTDVPGDPHSPVLLGWVRVQFGNVALYRREARNPVTIQRYARDLPPDAWDRVLFDRAWLGLGLGTVLLVLIFGPWIGLLAAFVHMNIYLASNAAVNAMGHHFGKRPYPNLAGNLQWLAWLTAGEGLHNNHHAAASAARLSHRRWEFDPGWWVISLLTALGLADVRVQPEVLVERAAKRAA